MADTNSNVNEDLTACDEEPIHIINNIQPHGYLIALDVTSYEIRHASANCKELFDQEILGLTLQELDQIIDTVDGSRTLTELLNVKLRGESLNEKIPYKVSINQSGFNLITYGYDNLAIIELEPPIGNDVELSTQTILGRIMLKLNITSNKLEDLFGIIATEMRELLGFDRVMVYKFWDDWHGEVIAESKIDSLDPFLGLHYPATDIPKQARALYVKNLTRLIADVNAEVVPIHSNVKAPIDLSESQLRAVSKLHIEYLQNMGVGASYSISLVLDGKLWGLIACHHSEANFIDYERRKASEVISMYISNILELKTKERSSKLLDESIKVIDALDQQMRNDWDILKGLTSHDTSLLTLTQAEGSAIKIDDQLIIIGKAPSEDQVMRLTDWLSAQHNKQDIFTTTNLSQYFPESSEYNEVCSGLMAVTISKELKEFILFFKPEFLTEVSWAGKADKTISVDKDGKVRLSPRKSFEKWSEKIRGTSKEWTEQESLSAESLLKRLRSVIQLKSNEIRRLNEKLNQAYEELDTFSYTLSHDLKTPLSTIRGYLELFQEADASGREGMLVNKAMKNTKLMEEMISNILAYARLSRESFDFEDVQMVQVLQEIQEQLVMNYPDARYIIDIPENTIIKGNRTMLYQLFTNLTENALKYAHQDRTPLVTFGYQQKGSTKEITVSDNGIGIAKEHQDKIFGLFRRLSTKEKIEGSGVGLAIVKKIIESHKGNISVESVLGEGTTFRLTFYEENESPEENTSLSDEIR